jgi:hypothetical protein
VASQVQTDLDLLTSLLQNPVLRNILKLEDSLEELNQHLVHHPSLLPSDFDIDKTGTLVVNQNILQTHRTSFKTKGGKSSPALSNTSSSKQSTLSTVSPETHKRDVAKTGAAFQQSVLQAAAKREIIAIQVKKKKIVYILSAIYYQNLAIRNISLSYPPSLMSLEQSSVLLTSALVFG